jgi:hypothetical protein
MLEREGGGNVVEDQPRRSRIGSQEELRAEGEKLEIEGTGLVSVPIRTGIVDFLWPIQRQASPLPAARVSLGEIRHRHL